MIAEYSPKGHFGEFACPYIETCPDTIKLRKSVDDGKMNRSLADQFNELCLTGGVHCSTKKDFEGIDLLIRNGGLSGLGLD